MQLMWIENEFHHSFTSRSIFADKMIMVVIEGTKFSTKNVFREALTTKLTCKPTGSNNKVVHIHDSDISKQLRNKHSMTALIMDIG